MLFLYVLSACITLICVFIAIIIFAPTYHNIGFDDFSQSIEKLARIDNKMLRSQVLKTQKSTLVNFYKTIHNSSRELLEYERRIYENYYLIKKYTANSITLYKLPCVNGKCRLYSLIGRVLRENDGKLSGENLFNSITKLNYYGYLTYSELSALKTISYFCISEYLTVLSSHSIVYEKNYEKGRFDANKAIIDLGNIQSAGYLLGYKKVATEDEYFDLVKLCSDNGVDCDGMLNEYQSKCALYATQCENAINSLRNLSQWLNNEFILSLSKVDEYYKMQDEVFYKDNDSQTKLAYLALTSKRAKKR